MSSLCALYVIVTSAAAGAVGFAAYRYMYIRSRSDDTHMYVAVAVAAAATAVVMYKTLCSTLAYINVFVSVLHSCSILLSHINIHFQFHFDMCCVPC